MSDALRQAGAFVAELPDPYYYGDYENSLAKKQYFLKDPNGEPLEDFKGMLWRVATTVASAEKTPELQAEYARKFFYLMYDRKFCPGGRILAGAGTLHSNMLNCFVQGATDHDPSSFDGIMELAMKLAKVTKVGGGNGINLDPFETQRLGTPTTPVLRGVAYLSKDHPDAEAFAKGEMTMLTKPGAPRETIETPHWERVVVSAAPTDALVVPDSIEGIMETAGKAALMAIGGKVPHLDFSQLRPENAPIAGSGGTASGPFSFLVEIFEHFMRWANLGGTESGPVRTLRHIAAPTLRVIRQGGVRRGAGMGTLSITSRHALDFLTAKDLDREQAEGDISTFNISFLVTDDFMAAVKNGGLVSAPAEVPGKYVLKTRGVASSSRRYESWADEKNGRGETLVPTYMGDNGELYIPARWLWYEVAVHAWMTGEPGIIFADRINQLSALQWLGAVYNRYLIKSTNPCGEIPLTAGEPCDLGAANWAAYVVNGIFQFPEFIRDVKLMTRFLDNVLDVNQFALEDNRIASQDMRRLGLGSMGIAECLFLLGQRYSSHEGRSVVANIAGTQAEAALDASQDLAAERGAFPLMLRYPEHFTAIKPRRNVAFLTVAPTGTTSMIMATSGGLEPFFAAWVMRKVGSEYVSYIDPTLKRALDTLAPSGPYAKDGKWDEEAIVADIKQNHGSIQGLPLPAEIMHFEVAHDVHPDDHVRMQGVVQVAFDMHSNFGANSLSKTINLPHTATVGDILHAYTLSYETGCKGVTVYRDGSRQFQVLSTTDQKEPDPQPVEEVTAVPAIQEDSVAKCKNCSQHGPRKRAEDLYGFTRTIQTGEGKVYVTVNYDAEGPREVVVNVGKSGGHTHSMAESLGRIISVALQYRTPLKDLAKQLTGVRGGTPYGFGPKQILSIPDAVGRVLKQAPEKLDGIFVPMESSVPLTEEPG